MSRDVRSRLTPLDLVFIIDFTGSMGPYIKEACENIKAIVTALKQKEKHGLDFRLALVKYRDHDHSYVTEVRKFTYDVQDIANALDHYHPTHAKTSDYAEAVEDALYDAQKLEWRAEAKKICVLIGDAPAHGLITGSEHDDRFQENGCPLKHDAMVIINDMAEQGINLYVIGCGRAAVDYKDWFTALAHIARGQFMPLDSAKNLEQVLLAGIREELSSMAAEHEVERAIQLVYSAAKRIVDERALVRGIHQMLKERGIRTEQLRYDRGNTPRPSEYAKQLAKCATMSAARDKFRPNTVHSKADNPQRVKLVTVDISEDQVGLMVNKFMKLMKLGKKLLSRSQLVQHEVNGATFGDKGINTVGGADQATNTDAVLCSSKATKTVSFANQGSNTDTITHTNKAILTNSLVANKATNTNTTYDSRATTTDIVTFVDKAENTEPMKLGKKLLSRSQLVQHEVKCATFGDKGINTVGGADQATNTDAVLCSSKATKTVSFANQGSNTDTIIHADVRYAIKATNTDTYHVNKATNTNTKYDSRATMTDIVTFVDKAENTEPMQLCLFKRFQVCPGTFIFIVVTASLLIISLFPCR